MSYVDDQLEHFEPEELRQQVTDSWAREQHAQTQEEVASLLSDQMPFHFADPYDPRLPEFEARTQGMVYSPEILRKSSAEEYGGIEVEDQLVNIAHPVLVLAGRHDRTCSIEAAEFMAANIPDSALIVFEHSAHMTFVEENEKYLSCVREFLNES